MLFLGAAVGVPGPSVQAQVNFGVTPSIIEYAAKPGASGDQALKVTNFAETALPVSVKVISFDGVGDEYSAVDWLEPDADRVELAPQGLTSIAFSYAVPDDAPSGGAYARIAITTVQDETTGGIRVGGELLIGVYFEVEVDGDDDIRRELTVEQIAPTLEPDGRIGFRAEVTNSGNTLMAPYGGISFTSSEDEAVTASLEMAPAGLFPSVTGIVSAEGTLPLPAGSSWTVSAELFPGNPEEYDDLEPVTFEDEFTVDPQLEVTTSICENLDRGPTVTLDLNNPGSIGLVPNLSILLTDSAGGIVAEIVPQQADVAWPGERTSAQIEGIPQLTGGDYVMTATAQIVQGLDPIVTEVAFSIGGFGDNVAPLCGSEPESTPDE